MDKMDKVLTQEKKTLPFIKAVAKYFMDFLEPV